MNIVIIWHWAVWLTIWAELIKINDVNVSFFTPPKIQKYDTYYVNNIYGEKIEISKKYFNDFDIIKNADIVFLTIKAYDLENINISDIECIPNKAIILPLSNDIENNYHKIFHKNLVINSIIYCSSKKQENLIFNYSNNPKIIIDKDLIFPKNLSIIDKLINILLWSKIELSIVENFKHKFWRKIIVTTSINSACIYFNSLPKEIFSDEKKKDFLISIIKELLEIISKLWINYTFWEDISILNDISKMPWECPPSMYLDFINSNTNELKNINSFFMNLSYNTWINLYSNSLIFNKLKYAY